MSYIDREQVIDIFQRLAYDDWNQGVSTTWANAYNESAEWVMAIPSADVEPVRHGRWIDAIDHEQCSVCKKMRLKRIKTYHGDVIWLRTPYCDYCGAKMSEVSE